MSSQSEPGLVNRIWALFVNRDDAFGAETSRGWVTKKRPLTKVDVENHLRGVVTLAVHAFSRDNRCKWMAWDVGSYVLLLKKVRTTFPERSVLCDWTGGRSYHVWVFFAKPVPSQVAHTHAKEMARGIFEGIEFFPKQPWVGETGYGNMIRLPLGKHQRKQRWGSLIHPKSLWEVEPSFVPEYQPTFQELAEQCQHRVQEAKMDDQGRIVKLDVYDCLFTNGTVGLCREEQCPILLHINRSKVKEEM